MEEKNFWELTDSEKTYDMNIIHDLYEKYSVIFSDNKLIQTKLKREFGKVTEEAFTKTVKPQVEKVLNDINIIYSDITVRFDKSRWQAILDDDCLKNKYSFDYVRNEIIAYLMYHEYISKDIWEIVDGKLFIMRDYNRLKMVFPITFLQRIKNIIEGGSFFEYERIEQIGEPTGDADDYIRDLFELGDMIEYDHNNDEIEILIKKLSEYGFYHICYDVEIMNYLIKKGADDRQIEILCNKLKNEKNAYILMCVGWALWYLGEIDEADDVWLDVLDMHPNYSKAALGHVRYLYETECYELAKDYLFNVIEYNGETDEAMKLLADINEVIMKHYLDLYEENPDDLYDGIQYAWCLCQSGKWDEAIEFLLELEEDEMIAYDINMLLGRSYFSKNCYTQAIPYLQKWIKIMMLMPCDGSEEYKERIDRYPAALAILAEAFFETDNIEKAIYYMEQSMHAYDKDDSERLKSMTRLADFYNQISEYEKAFALADEVIKIDEYCIWAYVAHQKAAFETYNTPEVIRDYFVIASIAPDIAESYIYASMVYMYNNMYEDLELVIERAESNGVHEKCFEIMLFIISAVRGEFEDLYDIEKEFENLPKSYFQDYKKLVIKFYSVIKDKYKAVSDIETAIEYIDKIIQIQPDNVYFKWEKADIYFHNDDDCIALEIYKSIKNELKDNIAFLCDYAECLQYNDEWNASFEILSEALQKEDTGVAELYMMRYYKNLYNKTDLREDYEKAKMYINSQLEKLPDNLFSVQERAYLLLDAEDVVGYDIAIEDFRRLIYENYGDNVEYHKLIAKLYIKKGTPEKAIEELELVQETDDHMSSIYRLIANAYRRMNRKDLAEQTYRKAYQKTKNSYFAKAIADTCTESGKYRSAAIWYKKYMCLEETDIDISLLRLYFLSGNRIQAKKISKKVFNNLNEENAEKARMIAWHLFSIECDAENAIKCMEAAMPYTDDEFLIDIYSSLALYYRYINNNDKAVKCAEKLYELLKKKGNGSIEKYLDVVYGERDRIDNIVLYYIGINDFTTAEKYIQKIICGNSVCAWCNEPCCTDAYIRFAQLRIIQGDFEGMKKICNELLKKDTNNQQAAIYLKKIEELKKQYENYRRR